MVGRKLQGSVLQGVRRTILKVRLNLSSLGLHTFNKKRKNVAFFHSWRGSEKMLEALEEIRQAEEAVELKRVSLLNQIKQYSEGKEAELEAKKSENQQLLTKLVAEKEDAKERELLAEREELLAEAKEVRTNLQQQYEKHYQQAIDTIIERVRETYGSH